MLSPTFSGIDAYPESDVKEKTIHCDLDCFACLENHKTLATQKGH